MLQVPYLNSNRNFFRHNILSFHSYWYDYETKYYMYVRGLVKLKKNQKSVKNSNWSDNTHPPLYPCFFSETFVNMKTTQKKHIKKHTKIQQQKSQLGLDPPTHFRVFLGFLDFF